MHSAAAPPCKQLWWFTGAERGQWLALTAALLGWFFDGFEMGVFPVVARPALIEMLGLASLDARVKDKSLSDDERKAAKEALDGPVGKWYGVLSAVFLLGAALGGLVFGWI